jgi:drug/metabolite transporter (DMT)-like permease
MRAFSVFYQYFYSGMGFKAAGVDLINFYLILYKVVNLMLHKIKNSFHTYAGVTILFWSMAYVFTRMALPYYSAFPLGFLRYFVASCTLLLVSVFIKIKLPKRKDFVWFIAAGTVGFFLYMITFNKGCETVTASTSSVIIATVPVMTALLSFFIYKEKLHTYQWIAILVEFLGVVVLTVMNGIFSVNAGLLWLLSAAVLLSIYNLLQKYLTKTYSALQTTTFSIFSGTIMLTAFAPASIREVRQAPPITLVYIIILGVFSSAIAYVAWSKAFAKAEQTSSVSNYMFITPFLTTILGFFLAGESPDSATMIGGAIILSGILLFNFGGKIIIRRNN